MSKDIAWDQANARRYYLLIDKWGDSVDRGRPNPEALLAAIEALYGTSIDAKDRGNKKLHQRAEEMRRILVPFAARVMREGIASTARVARLYARIRRAVE